MSEFLQIALALVIFVITVGLTIIGVYSFISWHDDTSYERFKKRQKKYEDHNKS